MEQILIIPPLNLLVVFPFTSIYIIVSSSYDVYYFIALLFNCTLFITTSFAVYRIKFSYFEDFGFSGIPTTGTYEREIPSETLWWRSKTSKETKLNYPRLKDGDGAIMEIGLLIQRRIIFYISFIGFLAILSITFFPILLFNKQIPFVFYFLLVFLIMSMNILFGITFQSGGKEYTSLFALPINGYKLVLYKFIPAFIFTIPTFLILILIAFISNILTDVELLFVIASMGIIIISCLLISLIFGFLYFSSESVLTSSNMMETGIMGSIIAVAVTLIFNRWLYWLISIFIDNINKFIYIGLINICLILIFVYLYSNDFNYWGRKQRRRGIRIILTIIISVFLVFSVKGYPIFYIMDRFLEPSPYDETPTSWSLKVDNEMVIESQNLSYDDNIYITSSGDLKILNSTIVFECEEENIFGLYLSNGGKLFIDNCTFTTKHYAYGAKYNLYGEAKIINSEFSNLRGEYYNDYEYGGIRIYSTYVEIINTQLSNGWFSGIQALYSELRIINITITGCGVDGIQLWESDAYIADSLFENNRVDGIFVVRSDPTIENCLLKSNGQYGIHVIDGNPSLKNITYENNAKDEIYYSESK